MSLAPLPGSSNPSSDSSPTLAPSTFGGLTEVAFQQRGALISSPSWGLESGELQPQLLCRYAAGQATALERSALQPYLVRAPWALKTVTALTRGVRSGSSAEGSSAPLALAIVAAAKAGPGVDPYRIAGQLLLAAQGNAELAEAAAKSEGDKDAQAALQGGTESEDLLTQAACYLGLRNLERAQSAFEGLAKTEESPPELELAGRVARSADPDEALVELLQAL